MCLPPKLFQDSKVLATFSNSQQHRHAQKYMIDYPSESCNGYPYPWVPNTHPYPWVNGWVMGMGLDAWVGNGWVRGTRALQRLSTLQYS